MYATRTKLRCVLLLSFYAVGFLPCVAQTRVDLSQFDASGKVKVAVNAELLSVEWPSEKSTLAKVVFDLSPSAALFKSLQLINAGKVTEIASELDPAFVLTVGKRKLVPEKGWNIFFDRPNKKPSKAYAVALTKKRTSVISEGSRTVVRIDEVKAGDFNGQLVVTFYNGSPLMNISAEMATDIDSTAILYDAGLVSRKNVFNKISWQDTGDVHQSVNPVSTDSAKTLAVKYRTLIGSSNKGSLAIFPAPHQYFYPLDEAYNLNFMWYGTGYRNLIPGYGMGIRQDMNGDDRWVPWFNAPPKTKQRLNFYCLLSVDSSEKTINEVKRFTHNDVYKKLPEYKTMASHFHNEYVMTVIVPKKEKPGTPNFVNVFKNTGIDIVHLAEFHYTAHPLGPDSLRLQELQALHDMCAKYSDNDFLLLPGEEPNEFFGGHWLSFFPKPVNWIMRRDSTKKFLTIDPTYGKVYRVNDATEMLKLLELENGLAWTAHARTKGSTGFPDVYKDSAFFTSDHFMGAAWKNIPGDLSTVRMGKRVFDLMDDMANWGHKKHVIGESDLFSVEPENEMYAHLNVNYLEMKELPKYKDGWQPVLDVIKTGRFFVTSGEILLPTFTVNGKKSGETIILGANAKDADVTVKIDWTFPLTFLEIISGDGKSVSRQEVDLSDTKPFGEKTFKLKTDLRNKTWVRVEAWDVATNGAFTQQIWIK